MFRKIGLSLLGILALVAILFAFNDGKPAPQEEQVVVQQVESVGNADTLADHEDEHGDSDDDSNIDTE